MKKFAMDFLVVENRRIHHNYSLMKLSPEGAMPEIRPGQFVQVEIPSSKTTYLRRPISVNDVTADALWLLVRRAGDGTRALTETPEGSRINLILPLGNGFTLPAPDEKGRVLLCGGGVGVAPMLYWGKVLAEAGYAPEFLLAARSADDLLELDMFRQVGPVHVSTDDGSAGEKGVATLNSVLKAPGRWARIYCCGPQPMMKAIAKVADGLGAECEVSLENTMACGLGACLCCVENTDKGHVCVCTEGPVFNTKRLVEWHA